MAASEKDPEAASTTSRELMESLSRLFYERVESEVQEFTVAMQRLAIDTSPIATAQHTTWNDTKPAQVVAPVGRAAVLACGGGGDSGGAVAAACPKAAEPAHDSVWGECELSCALLKLHSCLTNVGDTLDRLLNKSA